MTSTAQPSTSGPGSHAGPDAGADRDGDPACPPTPDIGSGEGSSADRLDPVTEPISPDRHLVPATGAWREGDMVGERLFADIGDLLLETGGILPEVRVAYETWGTLNEAGDNAVLVEHALTGDSHVIGQAWPGHSTAGWWPGLIGPGAAIDTDHYYVVAPNVLGGCQGTTGPSSAMPSDPDGKPWGSRFPYLTVRDQVAAEIALADELGIERWALVIGGSMGGMRALEWAVTVPDRVERLAALATTPVTTADQIAWAVPQLAAIRGDARWRGGDYYDAAPGDGPNVGLGIARRIAHTTYRAAAELDDRFGRSAQLGEEPMGGGGRYAVHSYLDHHADKLARRFDANSYLVLTEAILGHDVGRGRGGLAAALDRVTATTLAVGVDSDRLYPVAQSAWIAEHVPNALPVQEIHSEFGHDGFLIETASVAPLVSWLLET